jgi:hypothetical protein
MNACGWSRVARRSSGVWRAHAQRVMAAALAGIVLAGCAGGRDVMSSHVPVRCHGATAPFETFDLRQEDMPGFIEPVLETALSGSLARVGLRRIESAAVADVTMVARFSLINLNSEAGPEGIRSDAFGDRVVPGAVTRFITHVDLELLDNRDGALVWRGTMDRPHAILGGETFHDDRAILIITDTLDGMLRGIRDPCAG